MFFRFYEPSRVEPIWGDLKLADLNLQPLVTMSPENTCADAINLMGKYGVDQVPVIQPENGEAKGVVTQETLLSSLASGKCLSTVCLKYPCRPVFSVVVNALY